MLHLEMGRGGEGEGGCRAIYLVSQSYCYMFPFGPVQISYMIYFSPMKKGWEKLIQIFNSLEKVILTKHFN